MAIRRRTSSAMKIAPGVESRLLLSGIVNVSLSSTGSLRVRSSAISAVTNDSVVVSQDASSLVFTSLAGTMFQQLSTSGAPIGVPVASLTLPLSLPQLRSVNVELGAGNDSLLFSNPNVAGTVSIVDGFAVDEVNSYNLSAFAGNISSLGSVSALFVEGKSFLTIGTNSATVGTAPSMRILSDILVSSFSQTELDLVSGRGVVEVQGAVKYSSVNDVRDFVSFAGLGGQLKLSSVSVQTREGNDLVQFLGHVDVRGRTSINTGAGNDEVRFQYDGNFPAPPSGTLFANSLSVVTGLGADTITALGTRQRAFAQKDTVWNLGDGYDTVTLNHIYFQLVATLSVDLGLAGGTPRDRAVDEMKVVGSQFDANVTIKQGGFRGLVPSQSAGPAEIDIRGDGEFKTEFYGTVAMSLHSGLVNMSAADVQPVEFKSTARLRITKTSRSTILFPTFLFVRDGSNVILDPSQRTYTGVTRLP